MVLQTTYKKDDVFKHLKVLLCDNGSEFKSDMTKLLENTMLTFDKQQQKTSIHTQLLQTPITKS